MTPSPNATCEGCNKPYVRRSTFDRACGVKCSIRVVKADKRAEKASDKAKREAMKPRSKWLKEAQAAFNAFIRARDQHQPCICCGRWSAGESRGGEWDAGHYRSTGSAPELRFDEANCHRQLKQCNRYGAGRAVDYRIGLIQRIGLAEVERLEGPQKAQKWSIDDLKDMKAEYRAKLKAITRNTLP